jgi:hypothetical protein
MTSKLKTDVLETVSGSGTIALTNQLSGMTTASLPTITTDKLGTGAILQVVTDIYESSAHGVTSSTSYVDSSLSASITPKFSNSKIIIILNLGVQAPDGNYGWARVLRDSTDLNGQAWIGNSSGTIYGSLNSTWVDTPSTTSSTAYKVQVKTQSTAGFYYHHGNRPSSLTLMEIKG